VRSFALVVVGGALGTLGRHAVAHAWSGGHLFPVATFAVNVTGAFALGLLLALLAGGTDTGGRRDVRLLLGTGLLGGYTTYSTLAVETDALVRGEHLELAVVYAVGSMAAGLVAAAAGIAAGRAAARTEAP
jgi:CrcB protein